MDECQPQNECIRFFSFHSFLAMPKNKIHLKNIQNDVRLSSDGAHADVMGCRIWQLADGTAPNVEAQKLRRLVVILHYPRVRCVCVRVDLSLFDTRTHTQRTVRAHVYECGVYVCVCSELWLPRDTE